tara:strand:- start:2815 stop:3351 length:537 start_codon:yes stop_codon:yes gene_type:complete
MPASQFFQVSPNTLQERFVEILLAPINYTEMLWIATPLIMVLFLTEIYFSRYKFEELGWNSAYGNVLVLLFVSIDLFRYLYNNDLLETVTVKTALAIAVSLMAFLLILINFFHLLPQETAYGMSSKLPINFIAYLSIIFVYSPIKVDISAFIASMTLLVIFSIIIMAIRSTIPTVIED